MSADRCPCTCERCIPTADGKGRKCGHPKEHGHVVHVPTSGGPISQPMAVHTWGRAAQPVDSTIPVAGGAYVLSAGTYVWSAP